MSDSAPVNMRSGSRFKMPTTLNGGKPREREDEGEGEIQDENEMKNENKMKKRAEMKDETEMKNETEMTIELRERRIKIENVKRDGRK